VDVGYEVRSIRKAGKLVASLFKAIWKAFDIRDVFVFGGIGMIFYGLWQIAPWISFVVCGFLLMLFGLGWLSRIPKAPKGSGYEHR